MDARNNMTGDASECGLVPPANRLAKRSIMLFAGLGAAIAVLAVAGVGVQFFVSHRNAVSIPAAANSFSWVE